MRQINPPAARGICKFTAATLLADRAESVIECYEDDVLLDQEVGPEENVVRDAVVEVTTVEPDHHGFTGVFVQYRGINVEEKAILVANEVLHYDAERGAGGAMVGRVIYPFPGIGRLRHLECRARYVNSHDNHIISTFHRRSDSSFECSLWKALRVLLKSAFNACLMLWSGYHKLFSLYFAYSFSERCSLKLAGDILRVSCRVVWR